MRKNRIKIVIITWVSIIAISCNNDNKSTFTKENLVQFDTLIVNKKHHLRNDSANPSCELNVQLVFPIESGKSDLKKLQQLFIHETLGQIFENLTPYEAVDQYVENFIKNYEADARIFDEEMIELENHPTLIPQTKDEEHENELQSNIFYTYYESLSNKIHFNQSNLLSFQVNQSNNKGEAATYSSFNNFVINLKTGSLVTENDIFVPGYDVALQQLFANSLMQQNEVKSISDLEDLGYFGIQEIMPNRNFLINNEGITYTFNKGEYSAYPLSAPEVFIPFNELKMLLKPNTVVSKIAGL
ncbi:MAG TPA: RsiV family protein [Dysgonamonadaceae bacterium]|jgi:hypothetical protein|nr:RsiV family protein [Dysgonamonadaceae bacterium]